MKKAELTKAVAKKANCTEKQAGECVSALFDTILEAAKNKEDVTIPGFGSFKVKIRAAKTARNPKTGEPVAVPERTVPTFQAGKALKEAAAQWN